MTTVPASGVHRGQRRLNGPQTTGREYHDLSEPTFRMRRENDVRIPLRDGTVLLADVYRPESDLPVPALVSASPYPRQIQDLGLPAGIVEAGASDFWVPRGYAHVIVNLRGTCGSGGTWTFFDAQERRDLHDVVEWVGGRSWCDGGVGMVGISYYAMAQLAAAVERPPALKAVFPFHITVSMYDAARHNGLLSSAFITSWFSALGLISPWDRLLRNPALRLLRRLLLSPRVHPRFATFNGEGALTGLKAIRRLPHAKHPWDDLLYAVAHGHPTKDGWWDERDLVPLLAQVDIPVYLGSDWTNVPMHLSGTFDAWDGLAGPHVRMAILGEHGLAWPWESMHVEALAWFDQWLKGRDTGITDGPPIRYVLPGTDGWRTAQQWPPPATIIDLALDDDGRLVPEGASGSLRYRTDSGELTWTSAPLVADLDVVGHAELALTATTTATDTAWIVLLEDVEPTGATTAVTQGWLQAGLREVDEQASEPGRPVLPQRHRVPVPPGEPVDYRIPLVATARRFAVGHRIRLTVTSDDTRSTSRPMLGFTHTPVGPSATNTVHSSSRLKLPVASGP